MPRLGITSGAEGSVEHARPRAARRVLRALVPCLLAALCLLAPAVPAQALGSSSSADPASSAATSTPASSAPASSTSVAPDSSTPPTSQSDPGSVATKAGTTQTSSEPVSAQAGSSSVVISTPAAPTGTATVTGGSSDIPAVSDQPLPSTADLQQAISAFLSSAIGSALPGPVQNMIGQSALTDVAGASADQACRCTVAVSIAVGAPAAAVAIAGSGPAGTLDSGLPARSSDAGLDVRSAEVSGATGDATSVSVSGHGPALAQAASGNSGVTGGEAAPLTGAVVSHYVSVDSTALSGAAAALTSGLLTDSGPTSATYAPMPCAALSCDLGPLTASANVAAYVPDGSSCAAASVSSSEWCTVAIAISLGSIAHASVTAPAGAVTADCSSGLVGRPTAVAIGVGGPAEAIAHMGIGGGSPCAGTAPLTDSTSPVSASSGSTGNSLAVGITAAGPAEANAASGNAGQVRAITDNSGANPTPNSAMASTGGTGEAVGISIGKVAANSLVRSGSSGNAAALCTGCTQIIGNTIADAQTGQTGGSYALAVAGEESNVTAASGDSGAAYAWAAHGSGAVLLTGQGTASTPNNVVQTGDTGQVFVTGRSGDTGNVVVTATSLITWVSVLTQSGISGTVTSTASWDANGCELLFATFTIECSSNAHPEPVGGTGAQTAPKPVVSAAEQGAVIVRRAAQPGSDPAQVQGASAVQAAQAATGRGPGSGGPTAAARHSTNGGHRLSWLLTTLRGRLYLARRPVLLTSGGRC